MRIIKPKSNDEASSADAVSADAKGENLEGANWLMAMIKRLRANKAAFYGTIAGILIAVCGGIFLFVRSRRAKRKREKAAALFSDDSEPPTQAFSTGQEANTTQRITSGVRNDIRTQSIGSVTSGPSIDIELSVMGSKEHSEKYNVSIKDRLSIGRKGGGASDFGVPGDATISAKHCELVFSKGRLQVIDLGSTNGTYVNGSPIAGIYPLNDGDRLLLGKTELRIKITGIR